MSFSFTRGRKLRLTLLVEKKSQKVLFAEVRKDVVDFLFSLLSLPIGSMTKLLTDESTFGLLSNTYRSWEQLDPCFLSSTQMTANSLIPVISPTSNSSNFVLVLSSACPATAKENVYVCNCKSKINKFTDVYDGFCNGCRKLNTYTTLSYDGPNVTKEAVENVGYVKDGVYYAVMDDLSIVPMMPLGSIVLLNKMGYKDLSLFEEKTVSLDAQQGFELLKTSLWSKNVLSDFFLAKKEQGLEKEVK